MPMVGTSTIERVDRKTPSGATTCLLRETHLRIPSPFRLGSMSTLTRWMAGAPGWYA